MRSLAALAVVLATVLVAAPAAPAQSANVERRATLEAAVVRELNRVRADAGLKPLRSSPSLRTAARGHSAAMLELGFFSHDSADGTAFSERIRRHYTNRGWRMWSVGEALLASQAQTIDATMRSSRPGSSPRRTARSSCRPTWRDAGIGALYAPDAPQEYGGAATIVVTADFGLREGKRARPLALTDSRRLRCECEDRRVSRDRSRSRTRDPRSRTRGLARRSGRRRHGRRRTGPSRHAEPRRARSSRRRQRRREFVPREVLRPACPYEGYRFRGPGPLPSSGE